MSKEAERRKNRGTKQPENRAKKNALSFLYVQSVPEVVYSIGARRTCVSIFMTLYVIHAFNMENSPNFFACRYKFLYIKYSGSNFFSEFRMNSDFGNVPVLF